MPEDTPEFIRVVELDGLAGHCGKTLMVHLPCAEGHSKVAFVPLKSARAAHAHPAPRRGPAAVGPRGAGSGWFTHCCRAVGGELVPSKG